MRVHRSQEAGFTLLEVVVATTLMAMLVAILFSGLRLGMGAWERGNLRLETQARKLATLDALNLQLSAAVPRSLTVESFEGRRPYLAFQGSSQQLRFQTRFSWTQDRSRGLWLANYEVVKRADGRQQLLIRETSVSDDEQLFAAFLAKEMPFVRSEFWGDPVDQIEFLYLDPGSSANPPAWISEWKPEEREELPGGVQVRWWHGRQLESFSFEILVRKELK